MERIFISHSSRNNAKAVALFNWLSDAGWQDEIFLDLDTDRGIAAGERWERRLHEAAERCEAVLFLISREWLASPWCLKELNLASRMSKRLFGVLIDDLETDEVPAEIKSTSQVIRLAAGHDHIVLRVVMPVTQEEEHVTFSAEGLQRLRRGLERAGIGARHFAWPPVGDPKRPPYPGLRPLETEDAGIFFGRDAQIVGAIDQLRGLRASYPPRLFAIIGASGAGKSSFLRAGLLPRLGRDDRNFLPLPIVRPRNAALWGDDGLLHAIEGAVASADIKLTRTEIRRRIEGGGATLRPLLQQLIDKTLPSADDDRKHAARPSLVLPVDQGEELFQPDGASEAAAFLSMLKDLIAADPPAVIAVFTIRSDVYEQLQLAKALEGVTQHPFSLPPIPRGSYAELIKGPALRLRETQRPLEVEDAMVDALLNDMDAGTAKDSLPLLAFTLGRLFEEQGGDGNLTLGEYRQLGGVEGSIDAAVKRAFAAADTDPAVPRDGAARLALLRRGFIPWLAGIDPDTGMVRRRIARLSEVPPEAMPLIQHLIDERLLATDVSPETGEKTIEPVHEVLLRQWSELKGWLAQDAGYLGVLAGIRRASRDWAANARDPAWLAHAGARLAEARRVTGRKDFEAYFEPSDLAYLAACEEAERQAKHWRRRLQLAVVVLSACLLLGGIWASRSRIEAFAYWFSEVRPYLHSASEERAMKPGETLRDCSACPPMVVIPSGDFAMGSEGHGTPPDERPLHPVTIAEPFFMARHETTVAEWEACVASGVCPKLSDAAAGADYPVANVSWEDASRYAGWLADVTGRPYRLPSEAEWEYAARSGRPVDANDDPLRKDRAWFADNAGGAAHPVEKTLANGFGLFDMLGNVAEWCLDVMHDNYAGAPTDGSPWLSGEAFFRVQRGGAWYSQPIDVSPVTRLKGGPQDRDGGVGFRVTRSILPAD